MTARLLLGGILLLVAAPASAAPAPGLDGQRFHPAAGFDGFASVEVGRTLPAGRLQTQLVLDYGHRPAAVATGELGRAGGLIDGLFAAHVRVALGLVEFAELDVSMAAIQFAAIGDLHPGAEAGTQVSPGDLEVAGRFRLLTEERALGVVVAPFVTLPTGRPRLMLSRGVPTFGGRVALSQTWSLIRFALHVGVRIAPYTSVVRGAVSGQEMQYGAAIGIAPPGTPVVIGLEMAGTLIFGARRADAVEAGVPEASLAPTELLASVRVALPASLSLLAGGGAGVTPGFGVPVFRAFAGLTWSPELSLPTPDRPAPLRLVLKPGAQDDDHDGVRNDVDRCPDEPEDEDSFEDEDGCPEGDLVLIRGDRMLLLAPVRFSGVTRIDEASLPVLDELVRLLQETPVLSFVRIEGHTRSDDRELSRLRALEVMRFLVRAGVDPTRLEAVGYGAAVPPTDGALPDRIEVRIMDVAGP